MDGHILFEPPSSFPLTAIFLLSPDRKAVLVRRRQVGIAFCTQVHRICCTSRTGTTLRFASAMPTPSSWVQFSLLLSKMASWPDALPATMVNSCCCHPDTHTCCLRQSIRKLTCRHAQTSLIWAPSITLLCATAL